VSVVRPQYHCEDRQREPVVLGLRLVTASVTPGMTGLVPCCDLSARGHRPRAGWRSGRLEEPAIRSLTTRR
jgi:hypothetical protein